MLGPWQLSGVPTPIIPLMSHSPAIDAGDNFECPASDQRGVPRPVDGNADSFAVCDIGAVEMNPNGDRK
jgi:hypothetical protein